MLWPVTIAGAVLGAWLGDVPGAILGGVLGHALDRHWRIRRWSELPSRVRQTFATQPLSFEQILFLCLGRIAKSEGRVIPEHLQLARDLMQQYRLDDEGRMQAMRWFNEGKEAGDRLTPMVRKLHRREPERSAELLDCCWRMALADGNLGGRERDLLDQWGSKAGLGSAEQQRMHQRHQRQRSDRTERRTRQTPVTSRDSLKAAALLLEVDLDATPEEIKRAYRRQLSRHHPDKLMARGDGEKKTHDGAGERIHLIQDAYERLKRYRGFR
ncbi:co-chaperone DjlA [Halopseudomonas sp.]|uniref:co-chaperone DjlA n=1 Tax=Halopseudomonas sp. TaxID=2901191 RepID=UPI0035636500